MKKSNIILVIILLSGIIAFVGFLFYIELFYHGTKMNSSNANVIQGAEKGTVYIYNAQELRDFSDEVNQGNPFYDTHVILMDDIDLQHEDFTPIGYYESNHYFYGIFDGNGHTIKNMRVTLTEPTSNNGLFGCLGGIVCNLTIENAYVEGYVSGAFCSIAIGSNAAIINSRCLNSQIVSEYTDTIGGQYYGKRINCFIDDTMDVPSLQENLADASALAHHIPMNNWMIEDEKRQMSSEKANLITSLTLSVQSNSYSGIINPYYKQEDHTFYFILPYDDMEGTGILNALYTDGTKLTLSVPLQAQDYPQLQSKILCSGQTPSVFIEADSSWPITYLQADKENILTGQIKVYDETGVLNYKGIMNELHGRGNDSWYASKKGYSLEIKESSNLLNLGFSQDYALISGYRDNSLLTYQIYNDLAKEIDMDYAANHQYVNLYINGEYLGLYFLTEKIQTGDNRIDIQMSQNDITGGYLYELDLNDYADALCYITENSGNIYVIREPKIISDEKVEYSKALWNDLEEAILSDSGYNSKGQYYADLIDIDSFAKQWLLYELGGEISISSSIYYYKESDYAGDGKVHAVYPWDVEHSFANLSTASSRNFLDIFPDSNAGMWSNLYKHPEFLSAATTIWREQLKPALLQLTDYKYIENKEGISSITCYTNRNQKAFLMEKERWGEGQDVYLKGNLFRQYLKNKIPVMDSMF